jgi:hypothetical protein
MTPSTLAPPRRPAGPSAAPAAEKPVVRRWSRPAHHDASRRIWRWALAGSVVVHILVLLLSPFILRVGMPPGEPDAPAAPAPAGMQMVDLTPAAERPVAAPSSATPDPASTTDPRVDAPSPTAVQPRAPAVPGSPADRAETAAPGDPLQPGIRDRRLWITPRSAPDREPTQEELHAEYMAGLERRLGTYNDSVAAEADRARRATDWTVRDSEGRRWGVSPEGIHLGGITLPPVEFPPGGGDPDRRQRAEEEQRTRDALDRQEADAERRRVREERIRATRERRDEERRSPP